MSRLLDIIRDHDGHIVHKWAHYIPIYERYFSPFIGKKFTFMEIGVHYGGSLEIWRKYFGEQATIVGVDIEPVAKNLEDQGYLIGVGDQGSSEFWKTFRNDFPRPDVILDDGSHYPKDQMVTFRELYDFLNDDGIFFFEDVCCNYLETHGGGLRRPGTLVEEAKTLVDELHGWWGNGTNGVFPTQFTRSCDSIHFYESIIVFEKKRRVEPYDLVSGNFDTVQDDESYYIDKNRLAKAFEAEGGMKSLYMVEKKESDMPNLETYPPMGAMSDNGEGSNKPDS